jgi:hypothetical protein
MPEPRWKKIARNLFFLLAITTIIPLPLSGVFTITAHNAGAAQPTVEKTVRLTQHGNTKYITPAESNRIRLMWMIFLVGFPSTLLAGFVLRFGFKVDILKKEPLPERIENLMNNLKEGHL